jgi:hypothetical protein
MSGKAERKEARASNAQRTASEQPTPTNGRTTAMTSGPQLSRGPLLIAADRSGWVNINRILIPDPPGIHCSRPDPDRNNGQHTAPEHPDLHARFMSAEAAWAARRVRARWRRPGAGHRVSPGSWPDFARIAESGVNQRRRPWARPYPDQVVLRAVGPATGSASGGRPTSGASGVVEPLQWRPHRPLLAGVRRRGIS